MGSVCSSQTTGPSSKANGKRVKCTVQEGCSCPTVIAMRGSGLGASLKERASSATSSMALSAWAVGLAPSRMAQEMRNGMTAQFTPEST
jgi:hypothetical protein